MSTTDKMASIDKFIRRSEYHPRGGELDVDAVDRYVEWFEAGSFPDPILVQRNTFVVIQGWHRIEAAQRAGVAKLPYQEIDVADEDIRYTAYQMDRDSAVPITREQRNRMIVDEAVRFTQEQLAERHGLTQQAIGYILNGSASNTKTGITSKPDHRKKVEAADVIAEWRLNPDVGREVASEGDELPRDWGEVGGE